MKQSYNKSCDNYQPMISFQLKVMSHNLFSSKFLSFTIYSKTERAMAQLLPLYVKTNFI